jgi:hypothetical protein
MDIEKITIFFTKDNEKGKCFTTKPMRKKEESEKRKGKSKGDWICQGGGS